MISPTNSALDTRVLTVEVYSLGYSALRRTFVMVLHSEAISWASTARIRENRSHQVVLVPITDKGKAAGELHEAHDQLSNS